MQFYYIADEGKICAFFEIKTFQNLANLMISYLTTFIDFVLKIFSSIDIETYRYLMSALIQVFGALIAIDGIFLIFQHDKLFQRKEVLLKTLGEFFYSFDEFGRSPNYLDLTEWKRAESFARGFLFLSDYSIKKNINETIEKINGLIDEVESNKHISKDRAKNLKSCSSNINFYLLRYNWTKEKLDSFKSYMYKIMGLPAFFCIIFSVLLFFADHMEKINALPYSMLFIILSAIVFVFLIHWACSLLFEPKPKIRDLNRMRQAAST